MLLGDSALTRGLAHRLSDREDTEVYANFDVEGVIKADLEPMDFGDIADFCAGHEIDILLPGSGEAITTGIRDYMQHRIDTEGLEVISPTHQGALMEGSREYGKELMMEAEILTPRYMSVDRETLGEGLAFLESLQAPYLIKADGYIPTGGVKRASTLPEAKDDLEDMVVDNGLGEAGQKAVIEEFVQGTDSSLSLYVDAEGYLILHCDDGADFCLNAEKRAVAPTMSLLKERDPEFRGFIRLGLLNLQGEPILLSYSVSTCDCQATPESLGDCAARILQPYIKNRH